MKRLRRQTAGTGCCACLCNPACGYVLALAGVVLQSVGQMVGVRLPVASRLYAVEARGPGRVDGNLSGPTHRGDELIPRLLLAFNHNRQNETSYRPVCLSLCVPLLPVACSVCLTDGQTPHLHQEHT